MGFADYFVAEDAYLALAKIQGGLAQGSVTGTTFWVDNSATGAVDSTGRGTFSAPLRTIDYAIGRCTDSKGDVILVMPGHAESGDDGVTSDIELDVIGVSIVGLGYGSFRPKLTITSGTGTAILVSAAGCRIENLRIVSSVSALASMIVFTGAGLNVLNCSFELDATGDEVNDIILGAAADATIAYNRFEFSSVASPYCDTAIEASSACDRLAIIGNTILGRFTTGAVKIATASDDVIIAHNRIVNRSSVSGGAITAVNSTTGIISDNRGHNAHSTAVTPGNSCAVAENYFSSTIASSGTLDPSV